MVQNYFKKSRTSLTYFKLDNLNLNQIFAIIFFLEDFSLLHPPLSQTNLS
jgi:hypothetical protein